MLKIYLARHGQNEDNANGILNGHRDLPLTELGRRQAQNLADGIKEVGLSFDVIYASPLSRAYDTAVVVTNTLALSKPEVLPSIIERDFGIMTGKPAADIEKYCGPEVVKTNTITYFLSPEGAETFPVLFERARQALADIHAKHSDGSALLVTHGDIGKMLYAAYYDVPWMNVLSMFHFGNSELLLLAQDSSVGDAHVIHIEQFNH
ncbi:phosphoglycerate mutase family protein [Patescibacteria group bacterium]|nr:phosphoglycerate mutase family protein [Patescibacteria group bacterium]